MLYAIDLEKASERAFDRALPLVIIGQATLRILRPFREGAILMAGSHRPSCQRVKKESSSSAPIGVLPAHDQQLRPDPHDSVL